jgi:hypothetical protein
MYRSDKSDIGDGRFMTRWAAAFLLIGALLFSACGGDSDDSTDAADEGSTVDASGAITGDQVCTLVSAEEVGEALDVEITDTQPQNSGTPGCVWYFDNGKELTGIVLAVLRAEDVEHNEGKEAYDYVVDLNRVFGAGAAEEKVNGTGDQAIFMAGKNNKILIVQDKKKVLTLAGPDLTKDGATAIGKKAAARLK